jgi:hypothetical protein
MCGYITLPANAGFGRTQVHHIANLSDVGVHFVCAASMWRPAVTFTFFRLAENRDGEPGRPL